jgi:hypothetical protein
MWWLWILGPVSVGLIFALTGKVDQRVFREIEAWREELGARRAKLRKKARASAEGKKKKSKDVPPKFIGALSRDFSDLLEEIGEGKVVGQYELAPGVAYARFVCGDAAGSSDHQSILVRLTDPGPTFIAKPLPLLDATNRVPNTGIEFRKDPEFFSTYLVEADAVHAKDIGKWLSRDLRALLCEHGDVWLHVQGRAMALSVYGTIRAEKIMPLFDLADVFVAEHGADDGPSLLGDVDRMTTKEKNASKHDDDDDEEDEAEEDDEKA